MSGVAAALVAAVLLGTACGLIGTFVVVRRMALTGDMLSHAVLPGIVTGLALCSTRHPHLVLLCAVAAGVLGSLGMSAILRHTRLKPDAALSIVLSVFFALGIALISRLQPAGVQAFLYGQIAAIDRGDLVLLCAVCALTLLVIPLLFRVLCLSSFDAAFARLLGVRVRGIELIFFLLLSVVIVVAMQAVGVVLVTALLVTPAAAARFCTVSLWKMAAMACVTGAAGGVLGVVISARWGGLPTGPLMALSVTVLFALALGFGPRSGLWPVWRRRRREAVRIAGEDVLKKLWLGGQAPGAADGIPQSELYPRLPAHGRAALRKLEADALVCRDRVTLRLTPAGCERATELVRAHRLWECYLTDLGGFKADHVHGPAERAEHWLDEQGRRELAEKLGNPRVDPHHRPIPGEGPLTQPERSD